MGRPDPLTIREMQRPSRDVSVFSTSALDLFASSLGAFILLVMILFPYYERAGSAERAQDFEELMGARHTAERDLREQTLEVRALEQMLASLQGKFRSSSRKVVDLESQLKELAESPVEEPEETKKGVAKKRKAVHDGSAFSLLGISTRAKKILIVVDMSGSMQAYRDIMIDTVNELLSPLTEKHRFAILGYQDVGGRKLHRYPDGRNLAKATSNAIRRAGVFARSLSTQFDGGTPTNYALQTALRYDVDAIVLLSDGAPTDMPGKLGWAQIVKDVIQLNRRKRIEIHTVAIGDYYDEKVGKELTLFMHELAKRNRGDFVGISR
jgi:hypothetical protein